MAPCVLVSMGVLMVTAASAQSADYTMQHEEPVLIATAPQQWLLQQSQPCLAAASCWSAHSDRLCTYSRQQTRCPRWLASGTACTQ